MKWLLMLLCLACAVLANGCLEGDGGGNTPPAPGWVDDADGGGHAVVAGQEQTLSRAGLWFRPACKPSPLEILHYDLETYEVFDWQACRSEVVASGQGWRCRTAFGYDVGYRAFNFTPSSVEAEVYHFDGVGSWPQYRLSCHCPNPEWPGVNCWAWSF